MTANTVTGRIRRRLAEMQMREGHLALPEGTGIAEIVNRRPKLSDAARVVEIRQAVGSAERAAIENAEPIIENARSWNDVHRGLAGVGTAYERKGSGAIIRVTAEQAVKASTVHRRASHAALEKRLGPFVPAEPDVVVQFRSVETAPGVEPELAAVLQKRKQETTLAQARFDHDTSGLAQHPILVEAIFGRRPLQPRDARHLASEADLAAPVVASIRVPPRRCEGNSPLGRLHAIVGADTYQLVGRNSSGSRVDLLASRRGPIDIVAQDIDMLQARATDTSIAMRSEQFLSIVIHGVSDRRLAHLKAEGFRPRLVVRIAEGDHQVLLIAPRSGSPSDEEAAADVQAFLTRTHGRATRSGYPPEVRLPVSDQPSRSVRNRRRSVQPAVIYESEAGVSCSRTAELLQHARTRIEKRPARNLLKLWFGMRHRSDDLRQASRIALYEIHHRDVHRVGNTWSRPVNPSRIDGCIAQRLRATGHSREDVASIIAAGSRAVHLTRRGDWNVYGRDVASYAFSPVSRKVIDTFSRFVDDWRHLEHGLITAGKEEEPEKKQRKDVEPVPPTLPTMKLLKPRPKVKIKKRQTVKSVDGPER